MIDFVYGLIYTMVYIFICDMFVGSFAESKDKHRYSRCIVAIWFILCIICSYVFNQYMYIKVFITMAFGIFAIKCRFDVTIIKSLLLMIIYQGLYIAVECVYLTGWSRLQIDVLRGNSNRYVSILLGSMSMISVYIIVLVVTRIFKNIRFYTLAKKEWIMLAVVPVFGIIVDLSLLLNFNSKMTDKQMSTVLFISIGMLVLNVGLFYMIQNIGMREKNIRENDLIYEQSKSAAHLYSNYSRQNKIAHEYKNQLLLLKILIEDEKYEDAQKYIKDINDESNKRINVIETNNAILNALINAKYSETIEKGIATTLNFNDLSRLPVSDMDLIIVLSNMLDNAIEASERISKEKRFIKTKIWLDEEKLLIAVVNNYDGRVKKRGEKILTSKEDNAIHGIGIGNIQSTVEKYGGTTQITTTDTEFRIVSIIPVKEHND